MGSDWNFSIPPNTGRRPSSSSVNVVARRRPISLGDLEQVHLVARAGRALDLEPVAVVAVELDQPAEDHDVHREPDRAAPVGVAAEHPGVRLGGQVVDAVLLPVPVEHARLLEVAARDRPDPVRAEELVLVEHHREDPPQPLLVDERQHPAALGARGSGRAVPSARDRRPAKRLDESAATAHQSRVTRSSMLAARTRSPRTAAAGRRASAP